MQSTTNAALILSLIAPLFSFLNDEDYGHVLQNPAWQRVLDAAGLPGSALREALELPSWAVRSSFQNEFLVSGMPFAAMPVESLYKPWTAEAGNEFAATRGLYLGDSARHLSAVYERLAVDVPEAFTAMPDHLTLELELMAMLLVAGNEQAARELAIDHFDWLESYDASLAERADRVTESTGLTPERRASLEQGIGFLRGLVALADEVVDGIAGPRAATALRSDEAPLHASAR